MIPRGTSKYGSFASDDELSGNQRLSYTNSPVNNSSTLSLPNAFSKTNSSLMQRFSALTDDFDDIDDDLQDPITAFSKAKKLCTGNKENEFLPQKQPSIPATNVELLQLLEGTSDGDHRNEVTNQNTVLDSNVPPNIEHSTAQSVSDSTVHDMVVPSSSNDETGLSVSTIAAMCNPRTLLQSLDVSRNEIFNEPIKKTNLGMLSYTMNNNLRNSHDVPRSSNNHQQLGKSSVSSNSFHQNVLPSSVENTGVGKTSLAAGKVNLLDDRSVQSHELLYNDRDHTTSHHSDQPATLPPQTGSLASSHHLWNSQSSPLTNIRPSFPGPAGLLPSLEEAEKNGSLDYMSAALSSYQEQSSKAPAPPSAPTVSLGLLWRYMLKDLNIRATDPASPIKRHNLERSVVQQQQQSCGGGALRRVPLLLVQVTGITPTPNQATLLLHDHTGEVTALLAASAVERWLPLLCCGSALVLTEATVWRRGPGRPAVLTVTADNVAALYTPANKEDTSSRGSSSRRSANCAPEVKVTSGLSQEERRQLKDTIGLDSILERSLVEENNDNQSRSSMDQGAAACGSYQGGAGGSMNITAANLASNKSYSGNMNQNVPRNHFTGNNLSDGMRQGLSPGVATPNFINRPPFNSNRPPINSNRPPFNSNRPPFNSNRPPFNSNRPPINSNRPPFNSNRPPFDSNRPAVNNCRKDGAHPYLPSHHNIPKNPSSFKSPCSTSMASPARFRFSPIIPSQTSLNDRGRLNSSTNLPSAAASHNKGGISNTPTSRPFGACGPPSSTTGGQSTNVHSTPLRPPNTVGNQPSTSGTRFNFKSNVAGHAVQRPVDTNSAMPNTPTTTRPVTLNQQRRFNSVEKQINQSYLRLHDETDGRVGMSSNNERSSASAATSNKNMGSGNKSLVNASAIPSDKELKEIQDLMTTFADGDFDDF